MPDHEETDGDTTSPKDGEFAKDSYGYKAIPEDHVCEIVLGPPDPEAVELCLLIGNYSELGKFLAKVLINDDEHPVCPKVVKIFEDCTVTMELHEKPKLKRVRQEAPTVVPQLRIRARQISTG